MYIDRYLPKAVDGRDSKSHHCCQHSDNQDGNPHDPDYLHLRSL